MEKLNELLRGHAPAGESFTIDRYLMRKNYIRQLMQCEVPWAYSTQTRFNEKRQCMRRISDL
jgi:hypothetical protein